MDVITYPCWDKIQSMLLKWVPVSLIITKKFGCFGLWTWYPYYETFSHNPFIKLSDTTPSNGLILSHDVFDR